MLISHFKYNVFLPGEKKKNADGFQTLIHLVYKGYAHFCQVNNSLRVQAI
jgi:hypothetical protein